MEATITGSVTKDWTRQTANWAEFEYDCHFQALSAKAQSSNVSERLFSRVGGFIFKFANPYLCR